MFGIFLLKIYIKILDVLAVFFKAIELISTVLALGFFKNIIIIIALKLVRFFFFFIKSTVTLLNFN